MNERDESPRLEKMGDEERELRVDEEDEEVYDNADVSERRGGRFGCAAGSACGEEGERVGGEVCSAPPYRDQST